MKLKEQHLYIVMAIIAVVLFYMLFVRKMRLPVKNARLTSKYGNRVHPITGKYTFHNGIDLAAPEGTPVTAPAIGVVENINYTAAGGNQLFIRHFLTGYRTGYAHLNKIHVKKNDIVVPGKHIADVGNTGQSTGPHLHLTLRKNGKLVDPLRHFG